MTGKTILLAFLLLPVSGAFCQTSPNPGIGIRSEWGWAQTWDDGLSPILRTAGLAPIDSTKLFSSTWVLSLGLDGWSTEVASGRVSNTLFTALEGEHRTRLVVDTSQLLVGYGWRLVPSLRLSGAAGVGVSKLLLQTYVASPSTVQSAWTSVGQASVVSDWNVVPVVTSRLTWKFLPQETFGLVIGVGVTASAFLGRLDWKLNNDGAISGLAAPWKPVVVPSVFLGIE